MIRTVPHFILEKAEKEIMHGSFLGLVAYFDITGFTNLTQSLIRFQNEGLENLGLMINHVFSPCLDIIRSYEGFISTFAGDSFTAVFPLPEGNTKYQLVDQVLPACFKVRDFFLKEGVQDTKLGQFEFLCKIGVSFGRVEWGIITNKTHNSYYFLGETLKSAVMSSEKATNNEIIVDQTIRSMLGSDYKTSLKETHSFSLETKREFNEQSEKALDTDPKFFEIQNKFFDINVIQENMQGEFRDVLACFIALDENSPLIKDTVSPLRIINIFSEIISLCQQYGGYFNKIDFGDKGIIILVLFGAPKTTEKIFQRAMEFSLQLKRNLLKLPKQNDLQSLCFKIGLSYGTTYTGFVGSHHRGEYTALGMVLNKAARYAKLADWNEILFDDSIERNVKNSFKYNHHGFVEIKSTKFKIKTYEILRKLKKNEKKYFPDTFVGRKKEVSKVFEHILHKYNFEPEPLILLSGATGIGKTRFLHHIMSLNQDKNLMWIDISFDEFNQSFYFAILDYFRRYFSFDFDTTSIEIETSIKEYIKMILENVEKKVYQDDSHIDEKEYNFIRNFLPRLCSPLIKLLTISDYFQNPDFDLQKLEKATFLNGLRAFFVAQTYLHKTILVFDDYQWVDSASQYFVNHLLKNLPQNLTIIFSYRDTDITLFSEELLKNHPYTQISLQFFEFDQINMFLQERFKLTINLPEHTIKRIYDIAGGNPFYLEQTYEFLTDNNLLNKQGELKTNDIKVSYNISNIIVSRLDKLSNGLKKVLKTASILGMEFSVNVLTEMLKTINKKDNIDISDLLIEGERAQIWKKIDNMNYIFRHSLLRDSLYNMQFLDQIKKLHNLAGETYERLFSKNSEQHSIAILEHYEKAGNKEKVHEFLMKAARYSVKLYQIQKAIDYYNEFLKINHDIEKNNEVLMNRAELYVQLNSHDFAVSTIEEIITYGEKNHNYYLLYRAFVLLGKLNSFKTNYDIAFQQYNKAHEYAILSENNEYICLSYGFLADICMYKMDFPKCYEYLEKQMEFALLVNDKALSAKTHGNFAAYYLYTSQLDKSFENFMKWHDLSMEIGDVRSAHRALYNIGIIYFRKGNTSEAKSLFLKCLHFAEINSDLMHIHKISSFLGKLHRILGENDLAEKCFTRSLEYARSINDYLAEITVLIELSILNENTAKLDPALDYLQKAEEICFKTKSFNSLFRVYTKILTICKLKSEKELYNEYLGKMELNIQLENIVMQEIELYILSNFYSNNKEFQKAIAVLIENKDKLIDSVRNPVQYFNSLGLLYMETEEFPLAHKCFMDALYFISKNVNNRETAVIYNNLGKYYLLTKDYASAINYYNESEKLKKITNTQSGVSEIYDGLIQVYLALKDKDMAENYCAKLEKWTEITKEKKFSDMIPEYRRKIGTL